jgi:DNA-binding MarR family transcriptional regulator
VTTEPDPSDRRATIVKITSDGMRFFADACAAKTEIEDMFKAVAGAENIALLMTTLEKLASAFSAYEHVGSEHPLGDESENS